MVTYELALYFIKFKLSLMVLTNRITFSSKTSLIYRSAASDPLRHTHTDLSPYHNLASSIISWCSYVTLSKLLTYASIQVHSNSSTLGSRKQKNIRSRLNRGKVRIHVTNNIPFKKSRNSQYSIRNDSWVVSVLSCLDIALRFIVNCYKK